MYISPRRVYLVWSKDREDGSEAESSMCLKRMQTLILTSDLACAAQPVEAQTWKRATPFVSVKYGAHALFFKISPPMTTDPVSFLDLFVFWDSFFADIDAMVATWMERTSRRNLCHIRGVSSHAS